MKAISFFVVLLMLLCCVGCVTTVKLGTTLSFTQTQETSTATLATGMTEMPRDNAQLYISRFLTDINLYGKIATDGETVAPGTLPNVSQIPEADQTLVGSDVVINLDSSQIPVAFLYHLDPSTGVEMLAAVISCDNIPMMIVFRPELGGVSKLCEALNTGRSFFATIVSITNISFEESMYAFTASENSGEDAIKLDAPPETDGEEVWLVGLLGTQAGQSYTGLFCANPNALEIYNRIFTRFSLDIEKT